ncbi:uncharacterized protein [Zea mays]|uniref:uncharacterized protein n=1 Tax=Zea mays TaxID=4577 RepID=UPI001651D73B|nr:uncharacterized protein LOC118476766 [Zea mays]
MEPVSRKRKGAPPVCSATRSLQDLASRKRACRGSEPQQSHCTDAPVPAVVMTAPVASGASAPARVLPGGGLKRKVGCIDNATRIGWRKRLESEYDLRDEIGHGKFGSVRVCRPKAGSPGPMARRSSPARPYQRTAVTRPTARWRSCSTSRATRASSRSEPSLKTPTPSTSSCHRHPRSGRFRSSAPARAPWSRCPGSARARPRCPPLGPSKIWPPASAPVEARAPGFGRGGFLRLI